MNLQGFKVEDGMPFIANIRNTLCEGIISIHGNAAYLCQNNKDGASCPDRKGFNYSWVYDREVHFISVGIPKSYKESSLVMSSRLYKILTDEYYIKVNGNLSKFKFNIKGEKTEGDNWNINIKSEANCFDIRNGVISYYMGKQPLNINGKWDREGRQIMKPSTFVNIFKRYLPKDEKKKNRLIELIASSVKSGNFNILVSENVGEIYETPTAKEGIGTLGSSCMRPEANEYDGKNFVGEYNKIKGLKIAYALNRKEELIARALLWHDVESEKGTINFMDRIYGTEEAISSFKEWAHENGYFHKVEQSYSNEELVSSTGETVCQMKLVDAIDVNDLKGLPYIDTMYIFNNGTMSSYGDGYDCHNTDGNLPTDCQCDNCGSYNNDLHLTSDTERELCDACCIWIEHFGIQGYYEYTREVRINRYYYTMPQDWEDEDYVWIESKDSYYHIDDLYQCEECDKYIHPDHSFYDDVTEKYYCEEHYKELMEERENELCKSESE